MLAFIIRAIVTGECHTFYAAKGVVGDQYSNYSLPAAVSQYDECKAFLESCNQIKALIMSQKGQPMVEK